MYDLAKLLCEPYTGLLLVLLTSLLVLPPARRLPLRRHRWALRAGIIACLSLWGLSLPLTSQLLITSLQSGYTRLGPPPGRVGVIVVLGGGVLQTSEDGTGTKLSNTSLWRCLRALELYRDSGPCQILVCGGKPISSRPGPSEAEVMGRFLQRQGVPSDRILTDDRSRSTYENICNASEIVRDQRLENLVLLTDARHLHRAMLCLRQQGLTAHPVPCNVTPTLGPVAWYRHGLPHLVHFIHSQASISEWTGILWYRLTGKL